MAGLAARDGNDVVIVSIGYRLKFNYGLRDQRNSFLWIQRHIAGFGGDPENITAFGESGGAASLFMHACSDVPVFHRVIIQSGSANVVNDWTLDKFDAHYHRLLSYLGINAATREERLKALREVEVSRFVDFIRENNAMVMLPFLGPESGFFPQQPFWTTQGDILANCPWIHDIMIGDDSCEGHQFVHMLNNMYASDFIGQVCGVLGETHAHRLLGAYEIHKGMDEGLFWQQAIVFFGDLIFSEPTHSVAIAVARTGRKRVYRWQFDLPNPFPGSMFSYTTGHHFVELMYQFMTLATRLPTYRNHFLRRQGEEMARSWIRFANGLPPMPDAKPYDPETGSIMVCDMLHGWSVRTRAEDEEISQHDPWGPRRYRQWEIMNEELKRAGPAKDGAASDDEKIGEARNQLIRLLSPETL
ncbi:Alpha/Beta hydrolase protein [Aspergillus floccosus]